MKEFIMRNGRKYTIKEAKGDFYSFGFLFCFSFLALWSVIIKEANYFMTLLGLIAVIMSCICWGYHLNIYKTMKEEPC
jgi:asparagine N-glycosylation enzyme membrane subunit Stt3